MAENVQKLAQTLLASKLAASPSEAQRMAQDMLGTSEKVQQDFKRQDQIYAIKGYGESKSTSPQESAAVEFNSTPPQTSTANDSISTPFLSGKQSETQPQSSPAFQQATTSLSLDEPLAHQGEVTFSSEQTAPVQQQSVSSWTDESTHTDEPLSVHVQSHAAESVSQPAPRPVTHPQASQQAQLLAQEALYSTEPRPEDRFASQFQGKTLAELSAEYTSEPVQQEVSTTPRFEEHSLGSDFLNMQEPALETEQPTYTQPVEPLQTFSAQQSTQRLTTGWPDATPTAPAEFIQDTQTLQQPADANELFMQEATEEHTQEITSEKKSGFTDEEKKLQEQVDVSKVFNFSNK